MSKRADILNSIRADGWGNTLTGLGTRSDKRTYTQVMGVTPLDPEILEALFHGDDLAARIVEKVVKDALRGGFDVSQDEDGELRKACHRWGVAQHLREAGTWGRLFGGGFVLVGSAVGTPETPLPERLPPGHLRYLMVLDRRDLIVDRYYRDPADPKFGEPEYYRIHATNTEGQAVATTPGALVHETRLVRIGGVHTSRRMKMRNNNYDLSVLQRPYDILRDTNDAWSNIMILFQDLSQAVFKMKGLIEMIAEGEKNVLADRMEVVNMARSVARAVLVDADTEEFSHVGAANVTGVDNLLMRVFQRLAAAAEMPVTLLLGMSPAGLNATGESDIRQWYDTVQDYRTDTLEPAARRLARLVADHEGLLRTAEELEVNWPSLWQLSPQEESSRRLQTAQTDALYLDRGVVSPYSVGLARWGGGAWSHDGADALLDGVEEAEAEDAQPSILPPGFGQQPPPAAPPPVEEGEEAPDGE